MPRGLGLDSRATCTAWLQSLLQTTEMHAQSEPWMGGSQYKGLGPGLMTTFVKLPKQCQKPHQPLSSLCEPNGWAHVGKVTYQLCTLGSG